MDKAKTIYFNNFGSKYFMSRNGEFLVYKKFKVSVEQEQLWTNELKKEICKIITDCVSKHEVLIALWHLSYLEISLNEKVNTIKQLISTINKIDIKNLILNNSQLFEENILCELKK